MGKRMELYKVALYSAVGGFHLASVVWLPDKIFFIAVSVSLFAVVAMKVARLRKELE